MPDTIHRDIPGSVRDSYPAGARGDFYLLFIGINQYLHFGVLKTAMNGAREVAELLGGDYGFEAERIFLLLDEIAISASITSDL